MKVAMVVPPLQRSILIAELSFLPLPDLSPTAMKTEEAQPDNRKKLLEKTIHLFIHHLLSGGVFRSLSTPG
jgi:hypothetical protein